MKLLTALLDNLSTVSNANGADPSRVEIKAVTSDSRKVIPGTLFIAIQGEKVDGTQFIADALSKGAVAVASESSAELPENIAAIKVTNARHFLAQAAAWFFTAQPEYIVVVTGTDGKTSTADFCRQLWGLSGEKAVSIGTLGVLNEQGKEIAPGTNTTPDPLSLHRLLAELKMQHCERVALEASSHGLDQYRLDGVRLSAAAFTYMGRDHLDYHATEEEYFAAKLRLFTELLPAGKTAVLNADDAHAKQIAERIRGRNPVLWYGKDGVDFGIKNITAKPSGQVAELTLKGEAYTLETPLVGSFQIHNMLAAAGLVHAAGLPIEQIKTLLPKLRGVPGRLEYIGATPSGGVAYIDYAHTPTALAKLLQTLRAHTPGKLHVVFGCGGDRDKGKRPEMGRIATELADRVIVTDDNPRSEDPAMIRGEILAKAVTAKDVAGREPAIYDALAELQAGDVLVVAGKGHEKTQIIGDKILPFDDAAVIKKGIQKL